ncbi:MAG: hypothetical protein AB9869_08130 [Verrucomicrobiia bacterium]
MLDLQRRERYRLLDPERLCWRLGTDNLGAVRNHFEASLEKALMREELKRQPCWTKSGNIHFTNNLLWRHQPADRADLCSRTVYAIVRNLRTLQAQVTNNCSPGRKAMQDLGPAAPPKPVLKINRNARAERRKLINDTIGQLLLRIRQKAAYGTIFQHVEPPSATSSRSCKQAVLPQCEAVTDGGESVSSP